MREYKSTRGRTHESAVRDNVVRHLFVFKLKRKITCSNENQPKVGYHKKLCYSLNVGHSIVYRKNEIQASGCHQNSSDAQPDE